MSTSSFSLTGSDLLTLVGIDTIKPTFCAAYNDSPRPIIAGEWVMYKKGVPRKRRIVVGRGKKASGTFMGLAVEDILARSAGTVQTSGTCQALNYDLIQARGFFKNDRKTMSTSNEKKPHKKKLL